MDELPTRLRLFQEVRKDRAAAMQIFSNAGQDQPEKMEAEAKQYVKGPIPSEFFSFSPKFVLISNLSETQRDFHDFNFSYNVFEHCTKVLAAEGVEAKI